MSEALLIAGTLLFSAAVLAVVLLRVPLRRLAGAQAQHQLWLLVPVVLLAAALAALKPERPLRWQIDLPAAELARDLANTITLQPITDVPARGPWLLALWLAGSLVCAVAWTAAHRRLWRARRLPAGGSAALVGALRPKLLLPLDFRHRFSAPERRLILLHERVHAERGDTRWLLLALVLLALQWFNPLAWWAFARLRADMELACDAALLRRYPGQLTAYRTALLRGQGLQLPPTATPCSAHPLVERLRMLPNHSHVRPRRWVSALLVSLAAGLAYAAQPQSDASAQPAAGYSKLRLDLGVSLYGERLPDRLALHTFAERRLERFTASDGSGVLAVMSVRPYDGDAVKGENLILIEMELLDAQSGMLRAKPRLITQDGKLATIETGEETSPGNKRVLRIEVLPRYVTTRLHDTQGALAELKRDIEEGRAPAVGVPR